MTDEKKLNDEPLENVSGGQSEDVDINKLVMLMKDSCYRCRHYNVDCPYGSSEDISKALGYDVLNCRHKEAKKR